MCSDVARARDLSVRACAQSAAALGRLDLETTLWCGVSDTAIRARHISTPNNGVTLSGVRELLNELVFHMVFILNTGDLHCSAV